MKKLYFLRNLLTVIVLLLSMSCTSYKKLPYIKEAETLTKKQLATTAGIYEAKIAPKDILVITVNSPTPGMAFDFNLPLIPQGASAPVQTSISISSEMGGGLQNYIVDNNGMILFPIIGKVKIGGMTKSQAEEYLSNQIYPKYLSEKPIVNIRFLSYKVTVLGEVARPGSYQSANEQMTIFEALAAAGDLTIHGKRNNVMLLRTKQNGEIEVHKINLHDKDLLLNKEIYYLQQNDQIIVETNRAKGNSSSFGSVETLTISLLSIAISVLAIVTR